MMRLALVLCAAVALGGCATADSVKEAKGQGVKRTFRHSHDLVYQAAVSAAAKRKLEVVEQDRTAGRLLLSHGISWGSWGEHIAIFVTRLGERSASVEIVSKPVLTPLNFPPDWPGLLFGDIELELAKARPSR